jgi:hypothetical protein
VNVTKLSAGMLGSMLVCQIATAATQCDRACLSGIVTRYLDALPKHDVKALPLAATARITENGVDVAPGKGIWSTAGKIERWRVAIDPESGNVAIQMALLNEGQPTVALSRVRVTNRRVVEIESVVAEKGKLFEGEGNTQVAEAVHFDHDSFVKGAQTEWEDNIPLSQRPSRQQLLDIAGTYFSGLRSLGTQGFQVPAFGPQCNRFENGRQVTNVDFAGHPPTSCVDQFHGLNEMMAKGARGGVSIANDRSPVVDTQKGIVLSIAVMAGRLLIADLFKVEDGQLRTVQITYTQLPQGRGTGWN